MKKRNSLIIVSVLLIFVATGMYIYVNNANTQKNTSTADTEPAEEKEILSTDNNALQQTSADPIDTNKLIIGEGGAKATIIEYADYKCPLCNQFHQNAGKEIRKNYIDSGKVQIDYRAVAFIGPDSKRAAIGAYCANNQGVFVAYNDAVYDYMWERYYKNKDYSVEYKDILTTTTLTSIAKKTGLNTNIFAECIESDDATQRVNQNIAQAKEDGVSGTPTFIVNNQKIVGPQPYNSFKVLIDIQLQ